MFGETTRPSNEQTRPYTARIREWEISLSRPSPVARRRLRHSLYVRIVCRTSPCNVYMEYRYPRGSCTQTSPPGTRGLLLVSQCCGENSRYLPLPSVCLVGRSVGLTIIRNAIWEKQRFDGFNGVMYPVSLWLFDSTRQRVYRKVLIKLTGWMEKHIWSYNCKVYLKIQLWTIINKNFEQYHFVVPL